MRAPRQGTQVRLPPDRLQNHNHSNSHVYVLELLQREEGDAQEFRRASSISRERMEGTVPPSHLSPAQRLSPSAPRTLTSSPSTLSKRSPQASPPPPLRGAGEPTVPAPGPGTTTGRRCTRGSQEPVLRRLTDAGNREQRSRPDLRQASRELGTQEETHRGRSWATGCGRNSARPLYRRHLNATGSR